MNNFLERCRSAVGAAYVLTDSADTAPHLTDWRRRYTGAALAVINVLGAAGRLAGGRLSDRFGSRIVP
ncbi:MAG TPA: hydroxyacid dehydrogenase, partial [Oxalobacteraceae bacterium]|nr:hydroxyacid dehydrogenase [Oxalobacteraceae bacterium]